MGTSPTGRSLPTDATRGLPYPGMSQPPPVIPTTGPEQSIPPQFEAPQMPSAPGGRMGGAPGRFGDNDNFGGLLDLIRNGGLDMYQGGGMNMPQNAGRGLFSGGVTPTATPRNGRR